MGEIPALTFSHFPHDFSGFTDVWWGPENEIHGFSPGILEQVVLGLQRHG